VSEISSQDYANFCYEIKQRIRDRQLAALRSVNRELVRLYWEIGELIHHKQETLGWGKSVVETLARDLQSEFPGRNGFSAANLWFMRQFYGEYVDKPNLQPLVREISWTKNLPVGWVRDRIRLNPVIFVKVFYRTNIMTLKERLIQEIEYAPETLIQSCLEFILSNKNDSHFPSPNQPKQSDKPLWEIADDIIATIPQQSFDLLPNDAAAS
jgi:predicted nuclease of restriction endonuclease-like (RecB) superfamily